MKETIRNMQSETSEWEKIIANEEADKESQNYTSSSYSLILEK